MVLSCRSENLFAKAALLVLAALLFASALPVKAFALETVKDTARPNGDSGSEVYGGSETRLTWEGQAADDESITGLTLTLPDGTTFGTKDARITMLTGEKLMDRTVIDAEVSAEGDTFVAKFPEAYGPGGYFRIELYEVFFPTQGGEMPVSGTYTLEDGTTLPFEAKPIDVVTVSATGQLAKELEQQEWVKSWNSNKFLRLFFNPPIIVNSIPMVFNGFLLAVAIVAVSFPTAIPIGLLLALMRMAKSREGAPAVSRFFTALLRGIGSLYVNVVRGTPLFLQIYIAFFGLPLAGISIPPFFLGWIVLSMNSAAYMCEIFRAGIQSIPKGQTEASRSLGMNGAQTMIFVIIPQTVSRVIPTLTSEFILLYKDTSMLAAVGVMEMVYDAKMIVANTGSITPYIVAACFYLVITLPLAKVVGNFERKLAGEPKKKRRHKRKAAAIAAAAMPAAGAAVADISADVVASGAAADKNAAAPAASDKAGDKAAPESATTSEGGAE